LCYIELDKSIIITIIVIDVFAIVTTTIIIVAYDEIEISEMIPLKINM